MSEPSIFDCIREESQAAKTRKLIMVTVHRRDYAFLEQMLAAGQDRIPGMEMNDVISAIVTEACRRCRETQSARAEIS